jgi:hypothetical protein
MPATTQSAIRRWLLQPLLVLLAIVFLIEAWCWDHLEPIIERIVARIPLRAFKERLAGWVEHLSPVMTLPVFLVPVAPLYPLKLFALALIAQGQWIAGLAVFAFAQLVGLGVAAFIFDVTKPKLLQLNWFAATYRFFVALREKARDLVAPITARIKLALTGNGDGWPSRTLRLIGRLRRRIREAR